MASIAATSLDIRIEPTNRPIQIEPRKFFPLVSDFPWPLTNDDLILNNALTIVMNTLKAGASHETPQPQEEAAELIVEAYNQGIRDPDILASYALKALNANAHGRSDAS